jgi:hypothetical protein
VAKPCQEERNGGGKAMSRGKNTKYKVVMCYSDGTREEDDEICETESEADEYGQYLCSCYRQGNEILHLSNPGDYPLDENGEVDFEIIEVDE